MPHSPNDNSPPYPHSPHLEEPPSSQSPLLGSPHHDISSSSPEIVVERKPLGPTLDEFLAKKDVGYDDSNSSENTVAYDKDEEEDENSAAASLRRFMEREREPKHTSDEKQTEEVDVNNEEDIIATNEVFECYVEVEYVPPDGTEEFGEWLEQQTTEYQSEQKSDVPKVETIGNKLVCPVCERLYGYKQGLNRHLKDEHPDMAGQYIQSNKTSYKNRKIAGKSTKPRNVNKKRKRATKKARRQTEQQAEEIIQIAPLSSGEESGEPSADPEDGIDIEQPEEGDSNLMYVSFIFMAHFYNLWYVQYGRIWCNLQNSPKNMAIAPNCEHLQCAQAGISH